MTRAASPSAESRPSFLRFVDEVIRRPLSRGQRVLAAVALDDQPIGFLAPKDRELARVMFGPDANPRPGASTIVVVAGARGGKSYVGALWLVFAALTARLDTLAPGERAVALAVAPDLRLARQLIRYARGACEDAPALRPLVESPTSDGFLLRRPDGRLVSVEALPATRGGSAVRGRTLVGAVLDEAAFFRGDDSTVNDEDVFAAIAPRVVPAGRSLLISTPWAESGLLYELHRTCWNRPGEILVAHASTETLRGDDPDVVAMVARERARKPENARREFDACFAASDEALLDRSLVDEAIDVGVTARPPHPDGRYVIGLDLATRHDSTAIVVMHRELTMRPKAPPIDRVVVDVVRIFNPRALGRRVDLDEVELTVATLSRAYNRAPVVHDIHLADALAPRLRARNVKTTEAPMNSDAQAARASLVVQRLQSGRVRLLDESVLTRELRDLRVRRRPGGALAIEAARGKHDDAADAFLLALEAAVAIAPTLGNVQTEIVEFWNDGRPTFERCWFTVTPGGARMPCEPPQGTREAEQARTERFARGIFIESDVAELGEEEVARRLGMLPLSDTSPIVGDATKRTAPPNPHLRPGRTAATSDTAEDSDANEDAAEAAASDEYPSKINRRVK